VHGHGAPDGRGDSGDGLAHQGRHGDGSGDARDPDGEQSPDQAVHLRDAQQVVQRAASSTCAHEQHRGLPTDTAVAVLHRFPPPDGADFRVPSDLATPAAFATLLAPRPGLSPDAPRLLPADQPLLQALAADGRASAAELGRATGWGEARAGQRLRTLLAGGRVYIDTDAALEALDYRSSAHLWLTVEPRTLRSNGEALAGHPDVAFVGAITGTANLLVSVILTDPAALYAFLAEPLGRLDGVRQVEVAPVLRWVKQAGTLVEGARLKL